MATTGQVRTFSELYSDLLNRVRAESSNTLNTTLAKRYINTALHDMHLGTREKFPWAERSAALITHAPYNTGTIAISQGSTTLTGTGTAWATANAFSENNARTTGRLVINGGPEVYNIASVDSDTQITLASKFVADTVSAGAYTYFEDEYALASDYLRPLSWKSFDINDEVEILDRGAFERRYVRNSTTGKPNVATLYDKPFGSDTAPVKHVRFHKPPDKAYKFDYRYITKYLAVNASGAELEELTSDTDEPILPLGYRHAIVFYALSEWYRDRRDDTRAGQALSRYTDIMIRITSDNEVGQQRPRIAPRLGGYVLSARAPYRRRRGAKYVAGTAWDELRE